MTSKKSGIKIVGIVSAILIFGALLVAYIFFFPNISPREDERSYVCIYPNSTLNDVLKDIETDSKISAKWTFRIVASVLGYDNEEIRSGRFEVYRGMNNFSLVRLLKSGKQTPVKLTFNNIRTKEQLAARISKQIMADSLSIINLLNDTVYLLPFGLIPETSIVYFIPDTYEVYWDTDAQDLFERMGREYKKFWNEERLAKAAAILMTPIEVNTLASIVEEETNVKAERPIVAGLYINRLRKNMPLQADPTVRFAHGDFSIRRILFSHLATESPYNTYKNRGLPPGPIRVTSKNSIDAVLNYAHHDYIFMCAKETFNGEHNFAATYKEHQANARRYQKALDARNIKK